MKIGQLFISSMIEENKKEYVKTDKSQLSIISKEKRSQKTKKKTNQNKKIKLKMTNKNKIK